MFVPKLELPAKFAAHPQLSVEPRPDKIIAWLDQLPLANTVQSLRDINDILSQYNRIELAPRKRFAAVEPIRTRIMALIPALRKEYSDATLPLSDRKQQRYQTALLLWKELANAYKAALTDLLLTEKEVLDPKEVLIPSLYHVINAHTESLIDTYALYAREPATIWLDMHQLYFYAAVHSITDIPFVAADVPRSPTINKAYRKAVLLTLCDPYHLLPGEIAKVALELDQSDALLMSMTITPSAPTSGQFVIDPNADSAPRYVDDAASVPARADMRTLDLKATRETALRRAQGITDDGSRVGTTKAAQTTLTQRQMREMYLRLTRTWGPRGTRTSARVPAMQHVALAAGLSAVHHCISDGADFHPELSEFAVKQRQDTLGESPLIMSQHAPGAAPSASEQNTSNTRQGRAARFETSVGMASQNDIWTKIYHTSNSQVLVQHTDDTLVDQHNATCAVRDLSEGGLALSFALAQTKVRTRVGDLVAIKHVDPLQSSQVAQRWNICAVRWLRTYTDNTGFDLGIELLAEDGLPVATRAVDGVGKGGEYFRGLIVPRVDPTMQESTLLVMPAIYDVGTILLLNTIEALMHVKLLKLIEGTSSFARFQFRVIDNVPVMK